MTQEVKHVYKNGGLGKWGAFAEKDEISAMFYAKRKIDAVIAAEIWLARIGDPMIALNRSLDLLAETLESVRSVMGPVDLEEL
jgi:hypothetical protein